MGCFSWLCKKCGKGILSSSFDGEDCILFLIQKGKVVEKISGKYNSYGGVFKENGASHELRVSAIEEVEKNTEGNSVFWEYKKWNNIVNDECGYYCELTIRDDTPNGIAAFHKKCFDGVEPTTKSKSDPNQGWGENYEHFGNTGKLQ